MKIRNAVFAKVALLTLLGLSGQAQAQVTSWNAYNDFYLSPTAAGWGGNTSALGTAWGYYAANVNGFGLPVNIGTYFTPTDAGSGSQNMYQYSNVAPIGAGTYVGASGWAATGGAGFGYYADTFGWGSSLGRYDTPWFGGAPGLSQNASNLIWMQSGWLSGGSSEGIAPVLTWKAPATGVYAFAGQFIAGNQYRNVGTAENPVYVANGASVAIVDSLGAALLARDALNPDATRAFSFSASYNAGDVVQFQVGSNYTIGNAVGLQVTATAIPEPSSGMLFAAGLGALGLVRRLRRQA